LELIADKEIFVKKVAARLLANNTIEENELNEYVLQINKNI